MATGTEAVEAIAKATGIAPVTVARAARTLKEAGGDLWPKAKPGGGINAAHVQPHHLAYLMIALMAADTMSLAAKMAVEHAALPRVEHRPNEEVQRPEEWQTFGGLLISLIHLSMFEEGRSEVREMFSDVAVNRGAGMASIGVRIDGGKVSRWFYRTQTPTAEEDIPSAQFNVRAGFPCEVFAILADLALNTQRATAYRDTGSIPAMGEPQADFAGETTDEMPKERIARETETPTLQSVGSAFLDAKSQPGANPVNVDPHAQRSDDIAQTQSCTSHPGSLCRPNHARKIEEKGPNMAQLKIADAVRILNAKFGANTTYMKVHAGVTSGLIPAERPPSGKGWVILESDLPIIAALLNAKPKAA
jgi:hypothetical protein